MRNTGIDLPMNGDKFALLKDVLRACGPFDR
jgi:hypothetical protein